MDILLTKACASGQLNQVKEILGATPFHEIKHCEYAFFAACHNKQSETLMYLLQHISRERAKYYTLGFKWACVQGDIGIVEFLIDKPETAVHSERDFAFKWVCQMGHIEIIKFLVERDLRSENIDSFLKEEFYFKPVVLQLIESRNIKVQQQLLLASLPPGTESIVVKV